MRVLSVNGGSSSLRLALVEVDGQATSEPADSASGSARKLADSDRLDLDQPPDSSRAGEIVARFLAGRAGPDAARPDAVGHRLVHGGDLVRRPTIVEDGLRGELDQLAALAPLHMPPALRMLDLLRERLPDVPHVVCPDTAFHADLPEPAATYPLPAQWRRRWGLRRFGFHGLSYAWALRRTAHLLGRPVDALHLVVAHLGGGASVCAIRGGRSVDTSMGFTPLDGVPMTKRSGAVDPGMLLWLLDGRLSYDELVDGLNHRSGLLGLSNDRSADTRELVLAAAQGDRDAGLALDVFAHRVRREIAAAATSLDRLDALVFTGEIGWDQPEVRQAVCTGLHQLGVREPIRGNRDSDGLVSAEGAPVAVLVVRTQEEREIATQVAAAVAMRRTHT